MNLIVDTVMQHLLSKDVLYQPMKVRGGVWTGGMGCQMGGKGSLLDSAEAMHSAR